MILPDGGNYVGETKNGKPNGQGTITLSDGGNYVGEFKNGKPNGQGTMTLPDGTKYIGYRGMEGWETQWARNRNHH